MKMETNGHHHNVSNGNLPEDHAKDDDLEDEEILAKVESGKMELSYNKSNCLKLRIGVRDRRNENGS